MIARFSGASVCKPTMISLSRIDIAGLMGGDGAGNRGDVEHPLSSLLNEQLVERSPERLSTRGRPSQKRAVAVVGLVILLNEIADVDFFLPKSWLKSPPRPIVAAPRFSAVTVPATGVLVSHPS
jgi:hypothetical protein